MCCSNSLWNFEIYVKQNTSGFVFEAKLPLVSNAIILCRLFAAISFFFTLLSLLFFCLWATLINIPSHCCLEISHSNRFRLNSTWTLKATPLCIQFQRRTYRYIRCTYGICYMLGSLYSPLGPVSMLEHAPNSVGSGHAAAYGVWSGTPGQQLPITEKVQIKYDITGV